MPPTRTRKAPKRGAEGGVSSDGVGVGEREEWEDAARDAARGQKAAMRKEHLAMILALRKKGKEMLQNGGMTQWPTEALGDCWLISLLAGSPGIDAQQAPRFTDNQRNTLLTSWRETLVEVAPHVDTKCFSMSGEALGIEYLKHVASNFMVSNALIDKHSLTGEWGSRCAVRKSIRTAVKPWKEPFWYGKYQQAVHVCTGLILKKNVLEIIEHSPTFYGECMRARTLGP